MDAATEEEARRLAAERWPGLPLLVYEQRDDRPSAPPRGAPLVAGDRFREPDRPRSCLFSGSRPMIRDLANNIELTDETLEAYQTETDALIYLFDGLEYLYRLVR